MLSDSHTNFQYVAFLLFSFFCHFNNLDIINKILHELNFICSTCIYIWNEVYIKYWNFKTCTRYWQIPMIETLVHCRKTLPVMCNSLPSGGRAMRTLGHGLRQWLLLGLTVSYVNWGHAPGTFAVNKIIFTYINTCSSVIQTMDLITRALSAPSKPVLDDVDQTSRGVDRQICSENMIHQADLLMRKLTAEYMKEASRKDLLLIHYISFNVWKLYTNLLYTHYFTFFHTVNFTECDMVFFFSTLCIYESMSLLSETVGTTCIYNEQYLSFFKLIKKCSFIMAFF